MEEAEAEAKADEAKVEADGDDTVMAAEVMGDDDVQNFGGGDELDGADGFGFGFEEAAPSAAQLAEVGATETHTGALHVCASLRSPCVCVRRLDDFMVERV